MSNYTINRGFGDERPVTASEYQQEGEYFVFYDKSGEKVLTIAAGRVGTIEFTADA